MKVAIYARVSTTDQDNQNQLAQLRKYCDGHGHQIVQEYVDVCSGGKAERKQLDLMLFHASQRRFDLLLFWSLDRLSREGVWKTISYLEELSGYGVGYKSYNRAIPR